jgi:hypothetical protein
MRAVMRVNPGQASKAMMWMPTRLNYGEGRCARGKYRQHAPLAVHRGKWERHVGKALGETWETRPDAGSRPARLLRAAVRPGVGEAHSTRETANPGGGKEPHFWVRQTKPRTRRLA